MFAGIVRKAAGQNIFRRRLHFHALVRPAYALKVHQLSHAAMRAAHPVVKTRPGLLRERRPDRPVLRGRCADLDDVPPAPPCRGALFGQHFGRGLVLRVLVLVQLVKDECANGLVTQAGNRARPAEIDRHVRQIDAQGRGVVARSGHVLPQARRSGDHGDDAIPCVFPRGDFIRENVHDRAGTAVDAPAHEIVSALRSARLRAFADDYGFHARRSGGVHDAGQIGGEQVCDGA